MCISGFTFLKNADLNGYPFVQSIKSILPLVKEFICVIGPSDDSTKAMVQAIGDPKIKIFDSSWSPWMTQAGFVYGQQKMIGQFNCCNKWAFYLEADEVIHEKDLPNIEKSIAQADADPRVEALYFDFLHFYGEPKFHGVAGYRQAPRIIRTDIRSIAPDGLFWVVLESKKRARYPFAISANATVYHYGHCRPIEKMNAKLQMVGRYWGVKHPKFEGYGDIDICELRRFDGHHPAVMIDWLASECSTNFVHNTKYRLNARDLRNRLRFWLENKTGREFSKKHFKRLD